MEIIKASDPILNQNTNRFDFNNPQFDIDETVGQMWDVMAANYGMGLAGPQVGLPFKIFIMKGVTKRYTCFNPSFIFIGDEVISLEEGCLSFPELKLSIIRPKRILAKWQDETGIKEEEMDGWLSRCFQHENDHLSGITFNRLVSKLKLGMAVKKQQKILRRR